MVKLRKFSYEQSNKQTVSSFLKILILSTEFQTHILSEIYLA